MLLSASSPLPYQRPEIDFLPQNQPNNSRIGGTSQGLTTFNNSTPGMRPIQPSREQFQHPPPLMSLSVPPSNSAPLPTDYVGGASADWSRFHDNSSARFNEPPPHRFPNEPPNRFPEPPNRFPNEPPPHRFPNEPPPNRYPNEPPPNRFQNYNMSSPNDMHRPPPPINHHQSISPNHPPPPRVENHAHDPTSSWNEVCSTILSSFISS